MTSICIEDSTKENDFLQKSTFNWKLDLRVIFFEILALTFGVIISCCMIAFGSQDVKNDSCVNWLWIGGLILLPCGAFNVISRIFVFLFYFNECAYIDNFEHKLCLICNGILSATLALVDLGVTLWGTFVIWDANEHHPPDAVSAKCLADNTLREAFIFVVLRWLIVPVFLLVGYLAKRTDMCYGVCEFRKNKPYEVSSYRVK